MEDKTKINEKLEIVQEMLEELGKVRKMLKKAAGPLGFLGNSYNNSVEINAQIRLAAASFKKLGKDEIADSKGQMVVKKREFILLNEVPQHNYARGAHTVVAANFHDNLEEVIPIYEDIVSRLECIRDELIVRAQEKKI